MEKSRKTVKSIWDNKFRSYAPEIAALLPQRWDESTEESLCNMGVYAKFAHYLLHEYKTAQNSFLEVDPVLGYLSVALNMAKVKFKVTGMAATKLFLTCLDPKGQTEEALWYKGLRRTIMSVCFQRTVKSGAGFDKSAPPVYLHHSRDMAAALMKVDEAEQPMASLRKLVLRSLFQTGGRTAEVAWLSWDGMQWDSFFNCVFIEVRSCRR